MLLDNNSHYLSLLDMLTRVSKDMEGYISFSTVLDIVLKAKPSDIQYIMQKSKAKRKLP